jgi:phosphocarrier protein
MVFACEDVKKRVEIGYHRPPSAQAGREGPGVAQTLSTGKPKDGAICGNPMPELREEMVISNTLGMHLRPAQRLVQTVLRFQCEVHIIKDGHRVNAKSIMGLLTLAAAQGTRLEVVCDGEDAQEALEAVRSVIDSGFGEV